MPPSKHPPLWSWRGAFSGYMEPPGYEGAALECVARRLPGAFEFVIDQGFFGTWQPKFTKQTIPDWQRPWYWVGDVWSNRPHDDYSLSYQRSGSFGRLPAWFGLEYERTPRSLISSSLTPRSLTPDTD